MAVDTTKQEAQEQQVETCKYGSTDPRHKLPAPGRRMSFQEAKETALRENAELYRRLAK